MMPQQPQGQVSPPMGGALSSASVAPQDPATMMGTELMKLGPRVLGTVIMALMQKAGLPPGPQGLAMLIKGGSPAGAGTPPAGGPPGGFAGLQRPQMQTPSAQPGIGR